VTTAEYRLLGPLEVCDGDARIELGGAKQRALLALLVLNANKVVARERLIDELWGARPPATAVKSVQVYVSRLRKLLPTGALETRAPGYLLEVAPDQVDLLRFERLVAAARRVEPADASRLLREALALWRGQALAEFEEPFAKAEAGRLEHQRLAALEERLDADLALGRHAELVGELEALVAEHPHRERLRAQLMLALYRCDRQADALAAFRDARTALDELGLEPSARLRALEQEILTQHAALAPARAARRLSAKPIPLPGSLLTTSPFPFVGRELELAAIAALLGGAERGEGNLVLLSGEPGAGKTRLVRELAREAAARGATVLYGVSDPSVTVPYQPLLEWLEYLVRACDPAALAECLGEDGEALARLLPVLAVLTSRGTPAQRPESPTDRFLLQSSVVGFLRRVGELSPLVLVAEDIHWADGETLLLLGRLARAVPGTRLLVVASFRQPGEEIGRELADMLASVSRLDSTHRIGLDNLSAKDVSEFVREATDADASAELVTAIGELTDGTPLLLCELWRELVASDAIAISDAHASLARPIAELRSPERISELVDQRLSRLLPVTTMLIELAAVTGPRFELRVVAKAAGLDQPAFAAALEQAARSGIVEDLPAAAPAGRFTHELLRRAVYDRISGIRRAELHLRIGESLERNRAEVSADVVAELAHHFTLAAPLIGAARGVEYNVRAAEAAIASAAHDEAIARFSTALELGIAEPHERARVQADLGQLLFETGRVTHSTEVLAACVDAARRLADRALATRALVYLSSARLYADPAVGSAKMVDVARDAIATFEELDDVAGLAAAESLLGNALGREGRTADCHAALDRALVHADAVGNHVIRRDVIGNTVKRYHSGGKPVAEAIPRLDALRASTRNDPILDRGVRRGLAALLAMGGRFAESREHLEATAEFAEPDQTSLDLSSHWMIADAKELAGDVAGAEAALLHAFVSMREKEGGRPEGRTLRAAACLALLYCDRQRWDDAAECLKYGEEIDASEPPEGKVYAPLRLAARARVAAHGGRVAEALDLARQAVDLLAPSDWLNDYARIWLAFSEVQRAAGLHDDAQTSVAEALRLYETKGNVAAIARLQAGAAR
jgi:DNA-binding SARP family transcriptional activator